MNRFDIKVEFAQRIQPSNAQDDWPAPNPERKKYSIRVPKGSKDAGHSTSREGTREATMKFAGATKESRSMVMSSAT